MMSSLRINEETFVGSKFNRLTVVRPTPSFSARSRLYECLCDCGNTFYAPKKDITRGSVKSCKCLRLELTRAMGINRKGWKSSTVRKQGRYLKRTKKGDAYSNQTLNLRARKAMTALSNAITNLFDGFVYFWELECDTRQYSYARRTIENLSKLKHSYFSRKRIIICNLIDDCKLLITVASFYAQMPAGVKYVSLKGFKKEWHFGKATRTPAKSVDEAQSFLSRSAENIDITLNLSGSQKFRTISVCGLPLEAILPCS